MRLAVGLYQRIRAFGVGFLAHITHEQLIMQVIWMAC
jgi:hypothetical protein